MLAKHMLDPAPVNVRIKISGLWISMLFVFAFVDVFSLYRPDVRADITAGEMNGFTIGQPFLLGTTIYILIPSLMVFATLVLRSRLSQITNIAMCVAYGMTIIGGAIGEWNYYVVASAIEVAQLTAIVVLARRWPNDSSGTVTVDRGSARL